MRRTRALFACFVLGTTSAYATQTHRAPEGLYVHELAHVLFFIAMLYLIVRLCRSHAVKERPWFYIVVSAALFALWNVDAFAVHWLREYLAPALFQGSAADWSHTLTMSGAPSWIVYLGKYDHLLCVPAMFFLLLGLRAFNREAEEKGETGCS